MGTGSQGLTGPPALKSACSLGALNAVSHEAANDILDRKVLLPGLLFLLPSKMLIALPIVVTTQIPLTTHFHVSLENSTIPDKIH